tara:strand:+ start:171 stop:338 length:168 start_codon:yes stop_codon:yes gene_type:complete
MKMTNLVHDIEVLENAVIALKEGASDEKRMALWAIQQLVDEKKESVSQFESAMFD